MPHGMASFGTAYQILPFFLTSYQCQVPSLFPNTCNFVLQTFTPAKYHITNDCRWNPSNSVCSNLQPTDLCDKLLSAIFAVRVAASVPILHHFNVLLLKNVTKNCRNCSCFRFFYCFLCWNAGFSTWPVWWIECAVRNTHRSTLAPPVLFDSRTFQGSLQIPSQWNRAFWWWIRFILRCLDTYMMCYSYDSYELPPPCHNQLRSAQNLGVEKWKVRESEVKSSKSQSAAKETIGSQRDTKHAKPWWIKHDLNRFGTAISMQCRYHIHTDRLADLVWKKSLLPRYTLTRAWKMKPLVMVDATWRKFGETFHRGEPWSHMEPCGAKEPHPSMSPMLLMHHRVQRTIRWPNAWKQVLASASLNVLKLYNKH